MKSYIMVVVYFAILINLLSAEDWPSYFGSNGAFSENSGIKLIDDMTQVKPVWIFEDKAMGFGKALSSAARGYAKGTGLAYGGESSLIVAGGSVIHFYPSPCGEAMWPMGDEVEDEFKPFHKVSADETVIALDAKTGQVRWKTTFHDKGLNTVPGKRGGFAVTPCAANGKVFAMGTTARVYCLDLTDGKVVWESKIEGLHESLEKYKLLSIENYNKRKVSEKDGQAVKEKTSEPEQLPSRPWSRPYGMLLVVDNILLAPGGGSTLVGIDVSSGKELWRIQNALSGFNGPAKVKINGKNYIACINRTGELRLINHITGEVLWTHPLGSEHLTQHIFGENLLMAFISHPKITGDMFGKSKEPNGVGLLAGFKLTEKGVEEVWRLPEKFLTALWLDAGPRRKIVARNGLIYYCGDIPKSFPQNIKGLLNQSDDIEVKKDILVIIRESDGKILKVEEIIGPIIYLWGDKLIAITDIQHRPRKANPEIWQMYNADPENFAATGNPWHVNGDPPAHTATGGYEIPVLEPFSDGMFYCRIWGGIKAYDLRK